MDNARLGGLAVLFAATAAGACGGGAKARAPNPPRDKAEQTAGQLRVSALSKSIQRRLRRRGRLVLSRRKSEPEAAVEREARTRTMQIHLGVSQSSRDKEPLVAVSFGWASREQVERVVDEPVSRAAED